jgi:hypothetical protein
MGAREVVTSTLADVTVARRSLRRSPGFVVASVLSLGSECSTPCVFARFRSRTPIGSC